MTGRELLELAAKAAGYDVAWNESWQAFQHRTPQPDRHGQSRHPWVPLDDDGDALRLAARARLRLGITNDRCGYVEDAEGLIYNEYSGGVSECDSLRRAIVRVAAEIGKAMP